MAGCFNDVVKQGYVRIKSKKFGFWQRRWIVLHRASSKGPNRLEKYLDEKNCRSSGSTPSRVVILTDVATIARISSEHRKYALAIRFSDDAKKEFACDSDLEADEWVKVLWQECLGRRPGISDGEPDILAPGVQKELKERFHVYMIPNSGLDISGECLLQVTHENIHLWDAHSYRTKLVSWPLTALRRYGRDSTKFTFEAGRHCSTGEGVFVFNTVEGDEIYRKVHQATSAIAEVQSKAASARLAHKKAPHICVDAEIPQQTSLIFKKSPLHPSPSTSTVSSPGKGATPVGVHEYVNVDQLRLATAQTPKCRLTQHLFTHAHSSRC